MQSNTFLLTEFTLGETLVDVLGVIFGEELTDTTGEAFGVVLALAFPEEPP